MEPISLIMTPPAHRLNLPPTLPPLSLSPLLGKFPRAVYSENVLYDTVRSRAEFQSGSDDISTPIMHHLLPAQRKRRDLRLTLVSLCEEICNHEGSISTHRKHMTQVLLQLVLSATMEVRLRGQILTGPLS
ncbi:unnamed protein product [Pleuronectes platessa]|uniref:Uncharacterized protein n=1 Tax=Pleuronectes platessa TaxID=8262 RepID=A0A9N7ZE22_PLEPL|nr:unnamed protein product [Pleuronectes platessa]